MEAANELCQVVELFFLTSLLLLIYYHYKSIIDDFGQHTNKIVKSATDGSAIFLFCATEYQGAFFRQSAIHGQNRAML